MYTQKFTLIPTGTTATTTSQIFETQTAEKIIIELAEGGTVLNRSGALTVFGSIDGGTDFVQINTLVDNVTNTNAQQLTRVASKTRAAVGIDLIAVDLEYFAYTHMKVTLTVTDGVTPTGNFHVEAIIVQD
jgi:hypothetical protein